MRWEATLEEPPEDEPEPLDPPEPLEVPELVLPPVPEPELLVLLPLVLEGPALPRCKPEVPVPLPVDSKPL